MSRNTNSIIAASLHAQMTGKSFKTKAELLQDNVRLAKMVIMLTGEIERIEGGVERLLLAEAQKKNIS